MSREIQLSVVIAAGYLADQIDRCLRSLMRQVNGNSVEIIVCHSCDERSVSDLEAKHPDAVFLGASRDAPLPDLLGTGLAHAQGRVIAVTDATCLFDERWVAAITEAHKKHSEPVIGGAVEPAHAASMTDWAAFFFDYGEFMPPLKGAVARQPPGNNLSFKREVAGDLQAFRQTGFWKAHWCMGLQREGRRLILDPSVIVFSTKSVRLASDLRRRFRHGRCFAGMRIRKCSVWRRLAYAGASVVLPFVFFGRITANVLPKKRRLKEFILCSPIIGLSVAAWSAGEYCGYLWGAGESCSAVRVCED